MITSYQVVDFLVGIFNTYIIFKFMRLFYDKRVSAKGLEAISYVAFFIINTAIHFTLSFPWFLALSSILGLFLVSYNYKATMKNRILTSIYIFLIIVAVEVLIGAFWGYFGVSIFKQNEFENGLALILNALAGYILALSLTNLKNIKKGNPINLSNWISVLGIPLMTLYIIVLIFQSSNMNSVNILIAIAFLLGINIFVITMYDSLQAKFEIEMEKIVLDKQNKAYLNQVKVIEASELAVRNIKHDWRNHISVLSSLIDKNDSDEAKSYIREIIDEFEREKPYVQSGNLVIDSIMNLKLKEMTNRNIDFNIEVVIPSELNVHPYDLTTIIGNILDNAIEAASKVSDKPGITIQLKYISGRLIFVVRNPYIGNLVKKNDVFATTKEDKKAHGFGMKLVRKAIDKYDGEMTITSDQNVFEVSILLYVGSKNNEV